MRKIISTVFFFISILYLDGQEVAFHYTFNNNLTDSANKFDLEPVGGYEFTEGKYGEAILLNGQDQYLELNVENLNNPAEAPYTLCAWIFNSSLTPSSEYTEEIILAQKDGSADSPKRGRIQMYAQKNQNRMAFATWVGGGERSGSVNSHQTGIWQHIAMVFKPATRSIDFYVDGEFDTTYISNNPFEACTGGYRIGAHKNGNGGFWEGKIDELFLIKGELTIDDITKIKNNLWDNYTTKIGLNSTIESVNLFLVNATVGTNPGEYPADLIQNLNDSLTKAQNVFNNVNATQAEVDQIDFNLKDYFNYVLENINKANALFSINTTEGHQLNEGFSGYNMRISDGPWNYDHPDFREAAASQTPGFFRYFSGTRNDFMNHNTGLMELEWHQQVDSEVGNIKSPAPWSDYKYMEGKGPHTVFRLYDMCGELGSKLVVTWNGFTSGPDDARNFALFCKNNNIIVDVWQFVNEPNFYTPDRRFFWNDGGDFAYKMKEIGEAIREVFPDADLSPSYGWDGLGSFAKSVKNYQDSDTAWWNTVSFHSYAIHGKGSDFASTVKAANSIVQNKTNDAFFDLINERSWDGAKIVLTEVGTWNDYVKDKIYAGIYMAEYFMRMSNQPRAYLIGRHHIADAVKPLMNNKDTIFYAFENNYDINENNLPTDWHTTMEGQAHAIINKALNNSVATRAVEITSDITVPDNNNNSTKAIYAAAYQGMDSLDYILVTNKSALQHSVDLSVDNETLNSGLFLEYMSSENPEDTEIQVFNDTIIASELTIPPYCVMRISYVKDEVEAPKAPRIYQVIHGDNNAEIKWWKRNTATSYEVKYGTAPGVYDQSVPVSENSALIEGLTANTTYYFAVTAINDKGESNISNEVSYFTSKPGTPNINYVHENYNRITLHWESVPYANGYNVKIGSAPGDYTTVIDAGNVSGYVIRWLPTDEDFFIAIEAYNGAGTGKLSNEIEASTMSERPWAPLLAHATEKSDGFVQLSWSAPDSIHGGTYKVYYCPTPWNKKEYKLLAENITSTTYTDTTPKDKGNYYYRIKAENNITESFFYSNIATVTKNKNNIPETNSLANNLMGNISIYPNPAKSIVYVSTKDLTDALQLKIYSSAGQLVKQEKFMKKTQVSINDLTSGVYYIEIRNADRTHIEKLIVE